MGESSSVHSVDAQTFDVELPARLLHALHHAQHQLRLRLRFCRLQSPRRYRRLLVPVRVVIALPRDDQ